MRKQKANDAPQGDKQMTSDQAKSFRPEEKKDALQK